MTLAHVVLSFLHMGIPVIYGLGDNLPLGHFDLRLGLYLVTALCSEGSMFRMFYVQKIFVQKVLCSEGAIFRRSYVQKVLCSESPIFRRSYVQKVLCSIVQKVLYSEGSMFRRSYIQIYSEGPIFRKFFVLCRKKHTSFNFDL